jgi:two-component system alkaline phosphatase synthesis response regulator PhoP
MVKTVMIIDDEQDLKEMLSLLLESNGFKTVSASNGKDALKILKQLEQKPDLVIIDMFMPEMSGRQVCENIRKDEKLKDLKLAFLTVAAFSNYGKQMLKELNVLDYILKPYDIDDLIRRINKMIES